MTDRELLEKAAKAAGLSDHRFCDAWGGMASYTIDNGFFGPTWNPLKDDGDALRLAVALASLGHTLNIYLYQDELTVFGPGESFLCRYANDPNAATRRAIVRAAASIGEKQ